MPEQPAPFVLSAPAFLRSHPGVDSFGSTTREDGWVGTTDVPQVRAGEVHVWQVRIPAASAAADAHLLSSEERARANAFRFERDRARYCTARAELRRLLGAQLSTSPGALTFRTGPADKPYLVEADPSGLQFNVSHSHEVALIALARGREVGVDVEYGRANIDTVDIAERFFTPEEATEVRRAIGLARDRVFLACWTRKEAVMKALGLGLQLAPTSFHVGAQLPLVASQLTVHHERQAQAVTLHPVPEIAGYGAALAVCGHNPVTLRFWRR